MRSWTPEQEAAIIARGASLVVSAAAGSGKTAVLVERIIRLISDTERQCPAEQMVVVTFTNDAAAEVRTRLSRALTERVLAAPDDPWLRRQQTMLQSMKVSTIHSFCFDLLREQFALLNISAGFRIMEQTEEDVLRAEAASAVLEDFAQLAASDDTAKEELDLLYRAFCTGSDEPLEPLILSLYALTEKTPFGETLLTEAAEACASDRMKTQALHELGIRLREIQALYTKAMAYLQPEGTKNQLAVMQDECIQIDRILSVWRAGDLEQLGAALKSTAFGKLSATKKPSYPYAKALRSRAKEALLELREWAVPLQFAAEDLPRHAKLLRAVSKLVAQFTERLRLLKQERNAIGFGDAMTMTLSLLAERLPDGSIVKTPLAEQLSQQYACIMIDEFQDADNQQDLIFRMLSKGGSADAYGSNLFLVGDSKQCIYRFRDANPNNFYRAVQEGVQYHGPQLTENTCILLNQNFRSAEEVIAFINHTFRQLMTRQVGEIDYDETQALRQGAKYPEGRRPVEVIMLESDADEPQIIAERIAQHLSERTLIVDDEDGTVRPCCPKDFLILLRTATQMPAYADALTAAGVPVCSVEQQSYLQSPEIVLLLDILRAVDNPLLDISVAAAMLSPMIGFTLDELTQVRVFDRKRSLFQAMQKLTDHADYAGSVLSKKCKDFLDFLESMRLFSAMETPEQLIRRVYQMTDFLGLMQMTAGGEQKKANLRALITHAKTFEQSRGDGLSAFLRYLDALLARSGDLEGGGVPAGTENVVKLKTIHKSKGLQAPFVILAHSDNLFSNKDEQEIIQFHAELGIGFKLHDPDTLGFGQSLPYMTVLSRSRREAVSEELRLLYVALTRAREHLILPLRYTSKYGVRAQSYALEQEAFGGQTEGLTASVNSMREWLVMALVRNPACEQLRRILDITCETDASQPLLPVYIHAANAQEPAEAEHADEEQAADPDQADAALLKTLKEQCAAPYESRLAGLIAKYGVSELAKSEDFDAPLHRPQFAGEKHGLSGAERGTALHTFLQYAAMEAAAADLQGEIERLRAAGRLTAKQAAAVGRSSIAKFFTSPLYERIRRAEQVWREQKFTVRLSDLHLTGALGDIGADYAGTEGMLTGIMDLVFAEPDGIVLVDYKTDRVNSAEPLLERYTEQIRLYAEALRLLMDQPVKACYLYSLTLQKTVAVPTE